MPAPRLSEINPYLAEHARIAGPSQPDGRNLDRFPTRWASGIGRPCMAIRLSRSLATVIAEQTRPAASKSTVKVSLRREPARQRAVYRGMGTARHFGRPQCASPYVRRYCRVVDVNRLIPHSSPKPVGGSRPNRRPSRCMRTPSPTANPSSINPSPQPAQQSG